MYSHSGFRYLGCWLLFLCLVLRSSVISMHLKDLPKGLRRNFNHLHQKEWKLDTAPTPIYTTPTPTLPTDSLDSLDPMEPTPINIGYEEYQDVLLDLKEPVPSPTSSHPNFSDMSRYKLQVFLESLDVYDLPLLALLRKLHLTLKYKSINSTHPKSRMMSNYEYMLKGIYLSQGHNYTLFPLFRESMYQFIKSIVDISLFQGRHPFLIQLIGECLHYLMQSKSKELVNYKESMELKDMLTCCYTLTQSFQHRHGNKKYGFLIHVHLLRMVHGIYPTQPFKSQVSNTTNTHISLYKFYYEFTALLQFVIFEKRCRFIEDCFAIGKAMEVLLKSYEKELQG